MSAHRGSRRDGLDRDAFDRTAEAGAASVVVAVVEVKLAAVDAASLLHRAGSVPLNDYVVQLVGAVVSQEIAKGERGLRALALAESGEIEIGRPTPGP